MNIEKYFEIIMNWLSMYSLKIVAAILVLIIGKWIARKISKLLGVVLEKNKVDATLIGFLSNITYYALLIMVVIAAAGQLGINTTSFLTIVGAAGLAVGLALKDSLSNFASGVMLILFRPFRVGDFVTAGGVTGKVEQITIFTTIVNTPDNQRVIIPNGAVTSDVITNVNVNPTRRVDMVFGIGYDDDIAQAKKILVELLDADDRVLKDPAPAVAVSELADSSVNFIVRPWVKSEDYWGVYFDMHEKVKVTFDEAGISIPYPQQDLHLFPEQKEAAAA
jgi:small conductance mechanosensitive channel